MRAIPAAALTTHAPPSRSLQEADQAFKASCLRMAEVMALELHAVLRDHEEVARISFDIDGDSNSFPLFTILDVDDEDIEIARVDAIADRWNEAAHPTVQAFLLAADNIEFTKESFNTQVRETLVRLAKESSDILSEQEASTWIASFVSHLEAIDLEASMPQVSRRRARFHKA